MEMKTQLKWPNYNLPMSKLLALLFIGFLSIIGHAQQVNLTTWSTNYVDLNSYNGVTANTAYTIRLDGNGSLDLPTWRLSARVTSAVTNGDQVIPANKFSLIPTGTSGQFNPNNIPNVAQIGIAPQTILQDLQEVFMVPQALSRLYNDAAGNSYYNLFMYFNLKIEGGSYLANLRRYSQFKLNIEFKFYDDKNKIRGTSSQLFTIQIGELQGNPPVTNVLSLKVASHAKNSVLNLSTRNDYSVGAQIEITNGLMVQSTTDYELKVKSISPTFTSTSGATLPLNSIGLTLIPSTGATANVYPIQLSAVSQRIATGLSTNGNIGNYNIKYYTTANDPVLFQAKKENFSTTLEYEILPK